MFRFKSLEVDIYRGDKPNEMLLSTGMWMFPAAGDWQGLLWTRGPFLAEIPMKNIKNKPQTSLGTVTCRLKNNSMQPHDCNAVTKLPEFGS